MLKHLLTLLLLLPLQAFGNKMSNKIRILILFLVCILATVIYAANIWVGCDAEPADKNNSTSVNYTYIYNEASTVTGNVTRIQCWSNSSSNTTMDFAVFSKSGNDFTDVQYREGLTVLDYGSLTDLTSPSDFAAIPISSGQYIGFYLADSKTMNKSTNESGPGEWYDQGDQIGNGTASTFTEYAVGTDDIQIRAYVTESAPEAAGQVIIIQ